jgi:hypothetical protein
LVVLATVVDLPPEFVALLLKRREVLGVNAEVCDDSQFDYAGLVGTGYDLEPERRGRTPRRVACRSPLFRGNLFCLSSSRFLRLVGLLLFRPRSTACIASWSGGELGGLALAFSEVEGLGLHD